ncbi:hypothetical protein ABT294_21120 [Nonomuraea sp. NPDC000554]|uniref:SCO3933 family regulatory protein n=1 Tax=Nonomuraea sp. NPDC000554 TaxID=3154259 RepID=UPI0033214CC5
MRTIPIPVDVHRLRFTCAKAPRPRLANQDTGEIKTDKHGNTIYEVILMAEDEFGRIELVRVSTTGEPAVAQGQDVLPKGMIGYVWEIAQRGQSRWGISYKAADIIDVSAGAPERV